MIEKINPITQVEMNADFPPKEEDRHSEEETTEEIIEQGKIDTVEGGDSRMYESDISVALRKLKIQNKI